jgi:uncharacterized protein (DUF1499 family)
MARLLNILLILPLGVLLAGQLGAFKGHPPSDLGVREGRLKPPAATPNSVSSQADLYPDHPMRQAAKIAPLPLTGDLGAPFDPIRSIIAKMSGAEVIRSEPAYLYVQFTTRLMKYVDDVEFWFDPAASVIHVRSASRIGRSDLGVNRARIEVIRAGLSGASSSPPSE